MNVTDYQLDALKELINIGVGRAAGMLNQILDNHVYLQVPDAKILSLMEIQEHKVAEFDVEKLSAVRLLFKGPFSGTASLVFPQDSAGKLVNILTGEEPDAIDLDKTRASFIRGD